MTVDCPQCDRTYDTEKGMKIHFSQSHTPPWQDENKLRKLYSEKKMLVADIADKWDTTPENIGRWLDRHGIERRDGQEDRTRALRRNPASYCTTEHGYERWENYHEGDEWKVYVHRLLVVAEYGFEAMRDKQVHHQNNIPWDNRPENIEPIDPAEHGRHHSLQRWHGRE